MEVFKYVNILEYLDGTGIIVKTGKTVIVSATDFSTITIHMLYTYTYVHVSYFDLFYIHMYTYPCKVVAVQSDTKCQKIQIFRNITYFVQKNLHVLSSAYFVNWFLKFNVHMYFEKSY